MPARPATGPPGDKQSPKSARMVAAKSESKKQKNGRARLALRRSARAAVGMLRSWDDLPPPRPRNRFSNTEGNCNRAAFSANAQPGRRQSPQKNRALRSQIVTASSGPANSFFLREGGDDLP